MRGVLAAFAAELAELQLILLLLPVLGSGVVPPLADVAFERNDASVSSGHKANS
jgi:hypothetical protein